VPASYFLGARYLGQAITKFWDDATIAQASWVFVCPRCGDAWARVVEDTQQWQALQMACRKHDFATSDVGGSFIFSWLRRIDALPPEVLQYEAQLRLERYEREQETESTDNRARSPFV